MFAKRFFAFLVTLSLVMGSAAGARALEVDSGDVYCFTGADFSENAEEPLVGV